MIGFLIGSWRANGTLGVIIVYEDRVRKTDNPRQKTAVNTLIIIIEALSGSK